MGCISASVLSLISASCFLLYKSFLVNPYVLHSFDVIANGIFVISFLEMLTIFVCLFCILYLATLLKLFMLTVF